ncbi:MAG TPA: hypothetical protein PLH37_01570 [bacterium]|nr:hypothetical protein [bacterium]
MPLPFSHLVLSDIVLKKNNQIDNINESHYFIGSVFPDIRYLAKLPREKTHLAIGNSELIFNKLKQESNYFEKGILAHLYVDQIFLEYFNDYLTQNKNSYYPILFLLEQKVFNDFGLAEKFAPYFDSVLIDEANKYSINIEIVKKWHSLIQKYLSSGMNADFSCEFLRQIGMDDNFLNEIMQGVEKIKNNNEIKEKIENFKNVVGS